MDAFLSVMSVYCYLVIPRLARLADHPEVEINFRPVSPGVLRNQKAYFDRSMMEQNYFTLDAARTAQFLGIPFKDPDPSPVLFEPGSIWIASEDQPHIDRLMGLLMAAAETERGALPLYGAIMRLIWSGETPGWHQGGHVQRVTEAAGYDFASLESRYRDNAVRLRNQEMANNEAMLTGGHWGVPLFVHNGEPFYGQDRFDQLLWRLGVALPNT
ncbi:MAG: DsbA family protein [Alphaproteobacteria bacterium]|nr:DsbA family protein [Alphaproteobacteria bacterium]